MIGSMRFGVCLAAMLAAQGSAVAAPVFYRITGNGSGWLGPVFYSGDFEITATGDDSAELNPSPDIFAYAVDAVTISAGGNSVQSVLPMAFFTNRLSSAAGFVQVTSTTPLIIENSVALENPAFATYEGTTALGPIPVNFAINQPPFPQQRITTAFGDVTWVAPFFNVQFEAIPGGANGSSGGATSTTGGAAVPEPASLALLLSGLAGLAVAGCRRRT